MKKTKPALRLTLSLWGLALLVGMLTMLPPSDAKASGHEIVIGGTIAQSGRLAGIVRPFPKLFKAWADQVNARGGIYLSKLGKSLKIRTVLYDDQSSPPTALKFYERLATVDKVDLFIGPFTSFMTNAALQATVNHKIPMFMVEANDSVMFEKPNKWRATGLAPAQWEYKRVAELYARKGGVKRIALISRDSLHENQAREGFGDWMRKAGLTVVY
ncbi:MAG: ABC transporter substrate-binding protein, partial [bacterium]